MRILWLLCLTVACSGGEGDPPPNKDTSSTTTPTTTPSTPSTTTSSTTTPPTTTPFTPWVDCEALAIREDGLDTFYESNPTYDDPEDRLGPYSVVTPESVGLDPNVFQAATEDLDWVPFVNSFMVFKDGDLVWEAYLHGSEAQHSNNIHSASKSILSVATGIAVAQGKLSLDDHVSDILPEYFVEIDDPRKADITVQHLLEMTAGFKWIEDESEAAIEVQPDWVEAILALPLVADPGDWFNYNTGHTHLLSAVLQRVTGTTTCDYVHEEVFRPLDIAAEHWGRDPQGVYSGGYNVYLTPRELARFGLMVLDDGRWQGQQLVSSTWVEEMLAQHSEDAPYGYGRLWWMRDIRGHEVKIAWGYGGQFIYLVPDLDLAVVITTNTRDFDPWFFDAEYILWQYLIPAME